jgi:precorrin-6B methylase 1
LTAFIIGIGPGGGKFMTAKAADAIGRCEVVVGWQPALLAVKPLVEGKMIFEQRYDDYRDVLIAAGAAAKSAGKHLGILVVDDPLTYSAGIRSFESGINNFNVEIVPAIGSFQLAAAAAKVSLEDSTMIVYSPAENGSIDRNDLAVKQQRMLKSHRDHYHLIVMSDLEQDLAQTAAFLLKNGLPGHTEVMVGEELGSERELITITDLDGATSRRFHWMAMMVVKAPGA